MYIRLINSQDFSDIYMMWKDAGLSLYSYKKEQREFDQMLSINPDSCFAAFAEGKAVGSVFGTTNGSRGFVVHLAVRPAWQSKGIGKKLLQSVEKPLRKRNIRRIYIMIDTDNLGVVPFYEKSGYSLYTASVLMKKDI